MRKAPIFGERKPIPFVFDGGMNTADDQTSLKPGVARLLKNFEHVPGIGYRRVLGHQRVDGIANSAIIYTGAPFVIGDYTHSSPPAIGSIITQGAASGTIVGAADVSGGGPIFVVPASGAFTAGAATIAAFAGSAGFSAGSLANGITTPDQVGRTTNWAGVIARWQMYQRSKVTRPPGEGAVLGVWVYNGEVYAFRNAVGGATAVMWKMTTSGWVSQKTGLAPSGRYEFVNHNFGGAAGGVKMYGVSGTHKAFQWDGTTWTDITTGMATDTPNHIAVHLSRLSLSFPKGSVQWSSTNVPTTWSAITGAGEIGLGEEITALLAMRSDQLVIAGAGKVFGLYGSSFAVADLVPLLPRTGCLSQCLIDVGGVPIAVDTIGAFFIQQGQVSGDYVPTPLSRQIEKELKASIAANRAAGTRMFAIFARTKAQFRLFSPADKREYRLAFVGTKTFGWSVVDAYSTSNGGFSSSGRTADAVQFNGTEGFEYAVAVGANYDASGTIVCACAGTNTTGAEVMYGGTDSGFVVQLDQGNTFDGMPMSCEVLPVQTYGGSPEREKRVHGLAFEMEYMPDVDGKIGVEAKFELIADYGRGERETLNVRLAVANNMGLLDNYAVAPVTQDPTTAESAHIQIPVGASGKTFTGRLFFWQHMTPPFTLKSGRYEVQPLARSK